MKKNKNGKKSGHSGEVGKDPNRDSHQRRKRGDKGDPINDLLCRGCHALPSYKNKATFLCLDCWGRWSRLWLKSEVLPDSEVRSFKDEIIEFVKSRNRYVWHMEVYLNLRPYSMNELKRHGIKVAVICRELGFYAPSDDRLTKEVKKRVTDFVADFVDEHKRTPTVPELLKGAHVDHTTLWTCMDYDAFVRDLGGGVKMEVRHRFRNNDEFLEAAADVVRRAGCALHMTVILDGMNMSYPAYLAHFRSVDSDEIHQRAGISRVLDGVDSLHEVAARHALNELGWEVEPGFSFGDLTGRGNRPMKFDFKLSGAKILVEIDDDQHRDPKHFMAKSNILENDILKNQYARENGYQLIRYDVRLGRSPKAMKEYFEKHIGRGPRGPINPSNATNIAKWVRRPPNRRWSNRPREK